ILLTRGLAQIANATKEVQLESGHGGTGHIGARDTGAVWTAHAHVGRRARHLRIASDAEGRQTIGVGNAVLGPGLFHTRRGNAHVAIVVEGKTDQVTQARICEELLPAEVGAVAQIGRAGAAPLDRFSLRKGRGNGRQGPLVFGGQRAARERCHKQQGQEFEAYRFSNHHGVFWSEGCPTSGQATAAGAAVVGAACAACAPSNRGRVLKMDRMTTKNVGTKITASGVAANIPPNTPKPTAFWLAAPAPVAIASGTTPRMKAKDVMRIGRKRSRAASTVASSKIGRAHV